MLRNIPEELRLLKQWIGWKYVQESPDTKPTKVPINPYNGHYASPTNPAHWATFEVACSIMNRCDGLGFVITAEDPYVCIDLDSSNDPEIQQRQNLIYNTFDSYSEISPSGCGCHIWIKAKVPANRNRMKVEIYTAGHYMTITANCCRNVPIKDFQELATQLWEEMESKVESDNSANYMDKPEIYPDAKIIELALSACNGEKFSDLYEGRWHKYFPSEAYKEDGCNEADQALVNIIAFYTQNRAQIKRIFRSSVLGKRKKASREDYFEHPRWGMLNKSFDRQIPDIDTDTLRNNLEQQLAAKKQQETVKAASQDAPGSGNASQLRQGPAVKGAKASGFKYSVPPGLVGEIARFIHDAAPRPVPEIAIAAAIGLMSGVCGRSYNISGTGLNQYTFLIGATGVGKEGISTGIDKLMGKVLATVPSAIEFIGPAEIASPQALLKYLNKTSKSFVSILGEFADTLKQMSNTSRNVSQQGLRRTMLDLYNKSGNGKTLGKMIYSDKDKNTEVITAPSFSVIGEATPEKFYELLSKDMIAEGLLPRFCIIEYKGKRPQLNENHIHIQPSQTLQDQFAALCAYSLTLNNGNNTINVNINDNALQLFKQFDLYCDEQINSGSEVSRQLWNRAHIKALKLAALLAVGCNYINPSICIECAMWALELVTHDVENLLTRFESGEVGVSNVQNEQVIEIKKAFKKYVSSSWDELAKSPGSSLQTWNLRIVPHSFISSFCRQRAAFKNDRLGPINAIKTCLGSLIECDEIRELSPQDKKSKGLAGNAKLYMVSGMQL